MMLCFGSGSGFAMTNAVMIIELNHSRAGCQLDFTEQHEQFRFVLNIISPLLLNIFKLLFFFNHKRIFYFPAMFHVGLFQLR